MLEHVADPGTFLDTLRAAIGPNGAAYFEVPDALYTLRDLGIWDLIYEHCSYFPAQAVERLFHRHGFGIPEVESVFAGCDRADGHKLDPTTPEHAGEMAEGDGEGLQIG